MKYSADVLQQAVAYSKKRSRKKLWYRLVSVLSAFVVFVTTYALILPAITLSDDPICGIAEHTHSDECYEVTVKTEFSCVDDIHTHTDSCLGDACAYADFCVHTHSDICYSETNELICPLPVIEVHTHNDSCYEAVTETETETISEPETDVSQDTAVEESTAAEAVTDTVPETLTEEVPENIPETLTEEVSENITEETTESRTVSEEKIACCGKKEIVLHTHSADCFDENNELICGLVEIKEHIHSEECVISHTERTVICGKTEHVHDEALCFADENADTETAADWEKTLPEKLTGDYAYDLLLVAKSQLGYSESVRNVKIDAEGRYSNYSRFGAWYGDAYCEWQEEFVAFCLHYAGIPEDEFPVSSEAEGWAEALKQNKIFRECSEYEPKVGDIVFFSSQGEVSSVGIISEISDEKTEYKVIEGNTAAGKVEEISYSADAAEIYGFAEMPEKEFLCEISAHIHTDECLDDNSDVVCGSEEHCHTNECLGLYPLTDGEMAQVNRVIALIDAMPTADEIDEKLIAYEDADDMEGYQDYYVSVGQQGKTAYNSYSALNEKQKAYITDIDKLMESSWLWSAVTLAATAAERADDVPSVSGDGIKVQLFNYSDHVNKTYDHTAWRPIASYFTFRNSSTTAGDPPSETTIVPSWNINSDHDIDGFTKTHATVERVLSENGTPILDLTRNADGTARVDPGVSREIRDMAYLFSDTGDPEVSVYSPTNTFLQKNGNYYWYDSALNAVDYDISANRIRLRSYVERNSTTAGYTTKYGDFTPFNYTDGVQIGLNGDGVTPYHILSADVDYWFGMTMEVNFFQTKDGIINGEEMQFQFSGDDDVWVFVDDVLVLDLGGTHGTVDGKINFATGQVLQYLSWSGANATEDLQTGGSTTSFPTTIRACFDAAGKTPNGGWNADGTTFADYSEHTLKIFYMERGSAVANCKLSFSLPALPDKSLTVTKDLVADETDAVTDYIEDSLSYKFRVMKADSQGNSTGELFVKVGASFDIIENGNKIGTGTVGPDGIFSIKAGQSAQFTEMLLKGGGHINYVVEEILPDNSVGQYAGVEYDVSGAGGETVSDDTAIDSFTAYRTGVLSAEQTQTVTFRNKLDVSKLNYLEITKEIADNAVFPEGKEFSIQVKLGDILIPVGTEYTVGSETRTVVTEGVILLKDGETAKIKEGIISGTAYEIKELNTAEENMLATYSATVTPSGDVNCSANGVTGTMETDTTVSVQIVNQNNDFSLRIPVSKQVIDNDGTYSFSIDAVQVSADTYEQITDVPGTVITVNGTSAVTSEIVIGYTAGTSGRFYYKIFENCNDNDFIYDETFYILEIETTGSAANLISIKKNGTEEISQTSVLSFVNRKTVKLNVTKEIVEKLSGKDFTFTATITVDGEPFMMPSPSENAGYTVDGNVVSFKLSHNTAVTIPYIPLGASVTVSETEHKGFVTYYSVEGVHTELQEGDSVTLNFTNSDMTVHFTNNAVYELPETGSAGMLMYTLGGMMLIVSAFAVLSYKVIKRRKEDPASS